MENPKLFISYSWSTPVHEQWVLDLAMELRESGVDVILDKWDLKEGHDAVSFMEKMVTDPTIKKVLIVSDELYAAKADGRAGGVGTETQIISKEVYDNQEQGKFAAVVAQKDEDGKPCLPTYYKSRIYIDLSEPDKYTENFETLLRWIFDKPLHVKPSLGKKPSFLDESTSISLGTGAAFKRALSAIRDGKPNMVGAVDEYLSLFSTNLERFRITEFEGEIDDAVIVNIESFKPHRDEIIQIIVAISQYAPTEENIVRFHRFFESLIPYMDRPEQINSVRHGEFDNFKFIIHELFLYTIAILLKLERFKLVNILLTQQYYFATETNYGANAMDDYGALIKDLESLDYRKQRLKLNRTSIHADLIKSRVKTSVLAFRHLMQADFVLFMKSEIDNPEFYSNWYPLTLVYLGHYHSAFEIFSRAASKSYFDKMKCILNISEPKDLQQLMSSYKESAQRLPRWGHYRLSPSTLMGYELLATKP